MIELFAHVRCLNVETAAFKLATEGVLPAQPDDIARYINDHTATRNNVNRLNTLASKALLTPHHHTRGLLKRVGMLPATNVESVFGLLSRFVGVTHIRDYNEHMFGDRYKAGKNYVFRGGGWSKVLIFPYTCLPGRITGFEIIGRQGTREGDQTYHHPFASGYKPYEGGLIGAGSVTSAQDQSNIIAVRDVVLMGQIQAKTAHMERKLLPVVVWQDNPDARTNNAWDMFQGSNIVFWDTRLDAKLLRQAIRVDGSIKISRRESRHNSQHQRKRWILEKQPSGTALQRSLVKDALHWSKALFKYKREHTNAEFNKLLAKLEDAGEDMQHIYHTCKRNGFGHSVTAIKKRTSVRLGDNVKIVEHKDSWIREDRHGNMHTVSNFTVRLLKRFKDRKWYYTGYLSCVNRRYPFIVPAKKMTNRTFVNDWIHDMMLDNETPTLHLHDHTNRLSLLQIAIAFHEPSIIHGTTLTEQRRKLRC